MTPEGTRVMPGLLAGGHVLGLSGDDSLTVYPLAGGESRVLPFRLEAPPWYPNPLPLRVSGDGRFLLIREGMLPGRIARIELATGRRTPWQALSPGDLAGVAHLRAIRFTPDGDGYAYGYGRYLNDLYLVEGLRF